MSGAVDHYEGTPGARKGGSLTAWQDFEIQLKEREREIVSMLPSNVSRERFINSSIAAVKQNPDLLKASPRSLFAAVTKSAQDGLLPDGREGVITAYAGEAKWNPMILGLRKRARELDGLIIDAQVVYANDHFIWHQGDDPHIEHTPAQLGTPRGDKIGAYAIFKREDKTIVHREVMDMTQIETVRAQSKAKDSLMWTKFAEEGYRKTVVRRGIKSVPVSENLETVVRRDDELFNFEPPEVVTIAPPPAPPRTVKAAEKKALPGDWQDYLDKMVTELRADGITAADTQSIHDTIADAIAGANERGEISKTDAETIQSAWEVMSA